MQCKKVDHLGTAKSFLCVFCDLFGVSVFYTDQPYKHHRPMFSGFFLVCLAIGQGLGVVCRVAAGFTGDSWQSQVDFARFLGEEVFLDDDLSYPYATKM
jgi:hypothetical protein